jgi:hypothetical protein
MGAGAILIGLALFLLFRGPGPGGTGQSGSGTGPEDTSAGKTLVTTASPADAPVDAPAETTARSVVAPETVAGGLTDDEQKALSGDVLTVLIDERAFLIEIPSDSETVFRPTDLDRAVELAAMAKGDTNGIKVRILRRESSRASAEFQLKSELQRHGIGGDAIIMPGEFVP